MTLLDKVKALCQKQGVSQRKMEQDIGISNGASSKWGNSSPSIEVLQKLSVYFKVPLHYFLTDEPNSDMLSFNARDENDIAKRLEHTLLTLNTQEGLMFSGEPLDEATRELLKVSLENSLRIGKINAKQKLKTKKYRDHNKE